MNKVRSGKDKETWIQANVRATWINCGSLSFTNKSSTAKANLAIDKGASTYCSGSISNVAHYEKMFKELQRQPTTWDVVERTKKLKTGEWVND
ncbi:hypothetical protein Fmac_025612 [Flemingia macrophylla]|uniref:Uncharacterized protein n=1 Tax=Flemingia macrophylla TaxID=520843 RepID=A0ABD1LSS8_9FABA